jgi:uncharacterized spore protein YtfJ
VTTPPELSPAERLLDRATGARLCYGEPVAAGETTVIPVSRVRVYGGWGYGSGRGEGDSGEGSGGGGGGYVDAQPLGFVEVTSSGTRWVEIDDPERPQRLLRAGATAFATVVTALAGARRLRRGPAGSSGLLGR